MPLVLTAWCGHSDVSEGMARDLSDAIAEHGLKRVDAAKAMGLTEPQLSRELAGIEPLNLWRVAFLPIGVRFSFYRRGIERLGGAVITPQERDFILGFVGAGVKRMAKMAARFAGHERMRA